MPAARELRGTAATPEVPGTWRLGPRVAGIAKAASLDACAIVFAIAFAAPSVIYPLGHDHGVHAYVGREWLHGGLPYRDAFDHKPPGIFALHAFAMALFGEGEWPIRVA